MLQTMWMYPRSRCSKPSNPKPRRHDHRLKAQKRQSRGATDSSYKGNGEHRGVRFIGTADSYDTETKGRKVMRIARGLVNALYLDDLRERTHRGLAGQFERGFHAGGRVYGCTSAVAEDGQSRRMVIDETEAAVVRWVFEQFVDGHSVQHIVHQLNKRGTPSARGSTWALSAVQGSSATFCQYSSSYCLSASATGWALLSRRARRSLFSGLRHHAFEIQNDCLRCGGMEGSGPVMAQQRSMV
ncbi:recombinase family protein [Roseateles sp. LKC17W]|uniref:Recombinase family protein n=1 Tax=Pelomonas margarita TaxID=3299031 RepID=A0ABW7FKW6_9BURK